jgi:hypothetical protein
MVLVGQVGQVSMQWRVIGCGRVGAKVKRAAAHGTAGWDYGRFDQVAVAQQGEGRHSELGRGSVAPEMRWPWSRGWQVKTMGYTHFKACPTLNLSRLGLNHSTELKRVVRATKKGNKHIQIGIRDRDREVPRWVHHTRRRFTNRASTQGSQRILANFGQFLKWQCHVKPTYELHHAKVLALVQ